MPSIVLGYEYHIFISYRQKDNKRDGWVTEFIDTLKDQIEATFKEDISIYFDENPYDGLGETHDVDDSLNKPPLGIWKAIQFRSRLFYWF